MCPALLTGPFRVKGVPTPPQHHPRSLSLLPLSTPWQRFKVLQTAAKSCRSDKYPAPGALTNISSVLCPVQRTGLHNRYPAFLSFQNISHPCPSWGGISANAARLMTQPERAHPRHHRQWEHTSNIYMLTCHSFHDRVWFVKLLRLQTFRERLFPSVKMHPHFARGESDVKNTLWKNPSFFRRNVTFSPIDQDVYPFYLGSHVVMRKKTNPSRNVAYSQLSHLHRTRAAVSKELSESLGAKPESIPHALQTAGLNLFSGLSLYD